MRANLSQQFFLNIFGLAVCWCTIWYYIILCRTPSHSCLLLFYTLQIQCRVLNASTKFTILSIFSWMFVEGFYLHWLMVNTFHQPRCILLAIFGWCEYHYIPVPVSALTNNGWHCQPAVSNVCYAWCILQSRADWHTYSPTLICNKTPCGGVEWLYTSLTFLTTDTILHRSVFHHLNCYFHLLHSG